MSRIVDPVSIGIVAGRIIFRRWARAKHQDALADQYSAQQAYEYSRRRALEEQRKCIAGCKDLAENRKAVLDGRWGELHTFLVACGINGGLFAPPRRVFGNRPEKDVRSIIFKLQHLNIDGSYLSVNDIRSINLSVALGQGLLGLGFPVMHEHIADVMTSLSPEVGSRFAEAMGSVGDIEVGDLASGALSVLSVAVSIAFIAEASEVRTRTTQLRQETQKLDDKCAKLEAANERITELLDELREASYHLFKWTVVGQEAAHLQRAAQGRKRNVSDLPRWILKGLLRKATELWSTLEKPVFLLDGQEG